MERKQIKPPKRIEDMLDKTVLVIARTGHWYLGLLKRVDNRGIILTGLVRLEPEYDEEGNPVRDEELKVQKRVALPFIIPTVNSTTYHIRKIFLPWSNIYMIARAKPQEEIELERRDREDA